MDTAFFFEVGGSLKIICKQILLGDSLPEGCTSKKIVFMRINPEDKKEALKLIYQKLSDKLWIKRFNKSYIRASYNKRVEKTLSKLENALKLGEDDKITKDAGEYLVSELSREALINELNYLDIPLAELRKEQKKSNPGFDFHTETDNQIIIFGESKYLSRDNAYGSALSQIVEFIKDEKDLIELADLEDFVSDDSLGNFENGKKGYAAAFSSHSISNQDLLNNILKNKDMQLLYNYEELLLIAGDINE